MKVELSGGLGNQLFQYAAGRYLASKHDIPVCFYHIECKHRSWVNQNKLAEFKINLQICDDIFKISTMKWVVDRLNSRLSRTFKFYRNIRLKVFDEFSSSQIGFDKELAEMKDIATVKGYFQTFEYIDSVKDNIVGELEVRNPSEIFRFFSKEIEKIRPIVIHIRGGDYKSNQKKIGMLDKDYYSAALKQASKFDLNPKYWVFSDDKDYATDLLSNLGVEPERRIFPEAGLSDAETIKLMSLGLGIIICNSTFSWWAAYLNSNPKFIICPNEWFRGLNEPLSLCPPNWTRVESSWVT